MARKISMLAEGWWDYTTLDDEILNDAARLTADDILELLPMDIPQQTAIQNVCNYIDNVVEEALKKHNIFEE